MKGSVPNKHFWNPERSGFKDSHPETTIRDGEVAKRRRKASSSGSTRKLRKKAASPCRPKRNKARTPPTCKDCGLPISFVQRYSEKQKKLVWYVTNTDGTDHWDACSHAKWIRNGGVQYQNYGHTIGKDHEKLYDPADTSVPWVE